MVQPIINYCFYQPAQFLKPLRFVAPLGWMFEVGKRADFQSWTVHTKCLFSAVVTIGVFSEFVYYGSELLESKPPEPIHWIHELQKSLTLALLIDSLLYGYRTGSWSHALVNVSYQIPAIANYIFPNPTSPFVTRQFFNPPKNEALPDFVKKVKPTKNEELKKARKEAFGEITDNILATAVSTRPKHHIAITGPHPEAQEEAIESLSDFIAEKGGEIPLYFIDLSKITAFGELFTQLSPLLKTGKEIIVIQGLDPDLNRGRSTKEYSPLPPQLPPELISFLQNPDLHIILVLSPLNLEYLFKEIPTFKDHYESIKLPPLPILLKRKHFELAQKDSKYLGAAANVWKSISSFVGPEAPLRDYLATMGRIEGYMSLDSKTTFDASLIKLKSQVSHNRKHSALPSNLTELTAIDEEVICLERDTDLEKMIVILNSKSTKNNICFYGEAGCGKTQLARFFAQQIKAGKYPKFMGARVFSFKLSSIMAGSSFLGEWEGKLKTIFDFLKPLYQSGEVVFLFIDEIHMAIGAGKHAESQTMDIANVLKDYILHPNLRVIGATTPKEFSMYLTHDEAFMDRFTPYYLKPLTKENQLNALRAHSTKYSTDRNPVADKFLESLLSRGLTLRSAEGVLGQIHSYMELHPDKSPEDAASWVLASS